MDLLQVIFEPTPSSYSRATSTTSRESSPAAKTKPNHQPHAKVLVDVPKAKRRPIPRKGHLKSRNGCYNCKRRKVKCQETVPSCDHCARIGLSCLYPPPPTNKPQTTLATAYSSSLYLSPPIPPTVPLFSPLFTPADLRLFAHFLLKAYPPLPLEGESIWRDVAQLSHSFPYLIHSMLGLAASSLSRLQGPCSESYSSAPPVSDAAITHRTSAIRLLNKSLSEPCMTQEEGTARYATVMALTFQSSYMGDGMLEFVAMARGCHVVARSAMGGEGQFEGSPFGVFSRKGHVDDCRRRVRMGPGTGMKTGTGKMEEAEEAEELVLDRDVLEGVTRAFGDVRALLLGAGRGPSKLEMDVLAKLERIVALAGQDCLEAFDEVTRVYGLLGEADHDDFLAFADSENWPSQILLVYFFALEYLVAFHAMGFLRSAFEYRTATTRLWVVNLAAVIPGAYDRFLEWPLKFARTLAI